MHKTQPHERIVHTSNRVPAIPSPQSIATPAALAEAGGSSRQAKKRTICRGVKTKSIKTERVFDDRIDFLHLPHHALWREVVVKATGHGGRAHIRGQVDLERDDRSE